MKKKWIGKCLLPLCAVLVLICAALNQRLEVCIHEIRTAKITREITLAVAADLHNSTYGEGQHQLVSAILDSGADALLMVGDMADGLDELSGACALLEGLDGAMPVYYVSGNHEWASGECGAIKAELRRMGVVVLEGESAMLGEIRISGADDPQGLYRQEWRGQIDACRAGDDVFTLLMSHRPERVEYCAEGFDLVISGHAHGGQLRIPGLLPGLFAPNQGFFPEYTHGLYAAEGTQLFVTRGLCKNAIPRVFNRPELAILRIVPE